MTLCFLTLCALVGSEKSFQYCLMHGVIMKFMENSWFHVHDSAPAHRSVLVKDFLAKNDVTVLDHPSY